MKSELNIEFSAIYLLISDWVSILYTFIPACIKYKIYKRTSTIKKKKKKKYYVFFFFFIEIQVYR